jgi:hypothetical protein
MGSWYENMKRMKKPDYIVIKRGDKGLQISLQYKNVQKFMKIDEEVSIHLKGLNVVVEKGERWGDWGGPINCGSIITIGPEKKLQKLKERSPERVKFT